MTRSRPGQALTALAVVLLLSLVAGCGSMGSDGPVKNLTEGGQPQFGGAWTAANAGQPGDFTAFVVNTARAPLSVVSASLIPIGGHPNRPAR